MPIPHNPKTPNGWKSSSPNSMHYYQDYGLETRTVRFHNIFGPLGPGRGARKSPAAMCRKVACAKLTGNHEVEIWGDGEQTRLVLLYRRLRVGGYKLMHSDYREPLNLGQDRLVTINQLVDMVAHTHLHREKSMCQDRKVSVDAIRTTRACAKYSSGNQR